MQPKPYMDIVSYYEASLARHGDSHLGVAWPKQADTTKRHEIMLGVLRAERRNRVELLDFGCGLSHLYEYILEHPIEGLRYSALDISAQFVEASRRKFPENTYYCVDILEEAARLPDFDYIVMNGVFTVKHTLSFDEMYSYFREMIHAAFAKARVAIAFNVMSKHVDWERDDLFHLPFDVLAAFLKCEISRHFVFRCDYGLYEYTTYVYR